jgi:hypothetical protein
MALTLAFDYAIQHGWTSRAEEMSADIGHLAHLAKTFRGAR